MSEQLPLLLFPRPSATDREKRPPGWPHTHLPSPERQRDRLAPKFNTLQSAFDARRIQLQAAAPNDDPELVVVFETIGSVDKFIGAVKRTPGLEWLLEADEVDVEPDDPSSCRKRTGVSTRIFCASYPERMASQGPYSPSNTRARIAGRRLRMTV